MLHGKFWEPAHVLCTQIHSKHNFQFAFQALQLYYQVQGQVYLVFKKIAYNEHRLQIVS